MLAENCKSNLLVQFTQTAQHDNEIKLKAMVHEQMANLTTHLVKEMQAKYADNIYLYNSHLGVVLQSSFKMSAVESYETLSQTEQESCLYCCDEIKSFFRSQTNQTLFRAFNDLFKKDSRGKAHEWRDIEEAKIKEIFDCAKS